MSPLRAYRDLRLFLGQRHPHQVLFGLLAIVVTGLILGGFYHDSHFEKPYKRNIIYVEQWRADRSDAEILAQQKIDMKIKAKQIAEFEAAREKRRAQFERIDNQLTAWGF
nr:hypothetical protein [Hephaestia sp. MAHUQ-44]